MEMERFAVVFVGPVAALGRLLPVERAHGRIHVADAVNRRVVAVRFDHAVTAV